MIEGVKGIVVVCLLYYIFIFYYVLFEELWLWGILYIE